MDLTWGRNGAPDGCSFAAGKGQSNAPDVPAPGSLLVGLACQQQAGNRAQEPSPRTEPQNRAQEPSQRTMPTPPRLQLPDVNAGKAGRLHISFELAKCLAPIFPQALRWMGGHPAALQEMWTHGSAPRAPRFARRAHRAKSAAARGRGEEARSGARAPSPATARGTGGRGGPVPAPAPRSRAQAAPPRDAQRHCDL